MKLIFFATFPLAIHSDKFGNQVRFFLGKKIIKIVFNTSDKILISRSLKKKNLKIFFKVTRMRVSL